MGSKQDQPSLAKIIQKLRTQLDDIKQILADTDLLQQQFKTFDTSVAPDNEQVSKPSTQQGVMHAGVDEGESNSDTRNEFCADACRAVNLSLFHGNHDAVHLDSWLHQTELYFESLGSVTDSDKITAAGLHLRGSAACWWRSARQQGKGVQTWEQFKQGILSVFEPVARLQVKIARFKLRDAKQTGSLDSYVKYIRKLFSSIPGISESEKMDRFLGGLKPHLAKEVYLARPEPTTFEAMVEFATQHEYWHKSLQVDSHPLGHSHHSSMRHKSASRELGNEMRKYCSNHGKIRDGGKHMSRGMGSRGGYSRSGACKPKVVCYNCHKKGHYASECGDI